MNLTIIDTEHTDELIIVCTADGIVNKFCRNTDEEEVGVADIVLHLIIAHQVGLTILQFYSNGIDLLLIKSCLVRLNEENAVKPIVVWVWFIEPCQTAGIFPNSHLFKHTVVYEIITPVLGRNLDSEVVNIHSQILDECLTWISDQIYFQILMCHILSSYRIIN